MFNAITAILATILMVGAAIAGLTYLGSEFENNKGLTEYAIFASQLVQIQGSVEAYIAEHQGAAPGVNTAEAAATLIADGYMEEWPAGPWLIEETNVYRVLSSANSCAIINSAAHVDMTNATVVADNGCPPCDDPNFIDYPGCQRPTPNGSAPYTARPVDDGM